VKIPGSPGRIVCHPLISRGDGAQPGRTTTKISGIPSRPVLNPERKVDREMAQSTISFPEILIKGKKMKWVMTLILLHPLAWGTAIDAGAQSSPDKLEVTIGYLLDFIKNSDCRFIRNGKEHVAGEAVAHIQRKYQHFKDQIQTPEDFIRLTASKSLLSGKPYWIKTSDGIRIKSEIWLLEALEIYRLDRLQPKTTNSASIEPD
jgi:hypothetical protein